MSDFTLDTIEAARATLSDSPLDERLRDLFNAALAWRDEYDRAPEFYPRTGEFIPAGRLYKQTPEGRAILEMARYVLDTADKTE